jgi:hypothetical protein
MFLDRAAEKLAVKLGARLYTFLMELRNECGRRAMKCGH